MSEPNELRGRIRSMLGIPTEHCPLDAEPRGAFERDGITVERWVYASEPGSRIPAVLYRPSRPAGRVPAVALTFGHGGSKSEADYNYIGQVFARMGVACLAADPIGEEERHIAGGMHTRAHDPLEVCERADRAGRLIMGKLVYDTMRGLDFLESRADVDATHLGVAGNSLGGCKATWMAALDTRLRMAIVSGWAYDDVVVASKPCQGQPIARMREMCSWAEFMALAAPHCALLVMNGAADVIIDKTGDGRAWRGTRETVAAARPTWAAHGAADRLACWFQPGGGHRPYPATPPALEWLHRHLGTPGWALERIRALPTLNYGQWADAHGVVFEALYGTPLHLRGAELVDLGLRPMPREELACLRPDERGAPEYTLEGWLATIAR